MGANLRQVLAVLADRFCSEYPAGTPDLVAQIQAVALYGSDHKDSFLLEFHTSLCYTDFEFPIFLQDCSMGESDSLKLTFCQPSLLPGFKRFVVTSSGCDAWITTVTGLIDVCAFENICQLQCVRDSAVELWLQFKIGVLSPRMANSQELRPVPIN